MALKVTPISGSELEPHLETLGSLRIRVFREYPYLYDGSLDYERDYLSVYLRTPKSHVVLVWDEDLLVGATTCLPLRDADSEFQQPFINQGFDIDSVCYFGESIVLPEYRGRGMGKTFFQLREAHARSLPDILTTTFCAIDRPDDHPARPSTYRSPETLWRRCGYQRRPEIQARFSWKELDEDAPSEKTLTFWTRELFAAT